MLRTSKYSYCPIIQKEKKTKKKISLYLHKGYWLISFLVGFDLEIHMKFGKELRSHLRETIPEWKEKYLSYKLLKILLKKFPAESNLGRIPILPAPGKVRFQRWFIRMLHKEIDKFNDFYLDKLQDYVIRFGELKARIDNIKDQIDRSGLSSVDVEFDEELMEIRMALVSIYGEMLLLKNYSFLNFAGLLKITKKYDKRTGSLLHLPFLQKALHQPFYITKELDALVSECKAKLSLLFSLESGVNGPASTSEESINVTEYLSQVSPDSPSPLGVLRSVLNAISTMDGLRGPSSTHGPFSLPALFPSQDAVPAGAAAAQNSDSTTNHDGENEAPSR